MVLTIRRSNITPNYFKKSISRILPTYMKGKRMKEQQRLDYLASVLENMPSDWLTLTTHRLDVYDEELAKTQFIQQFEALFKDNNADPASLRELRTAYDYIRLGHPLSCILEWALARANNLETENVISFSSQTTPILAVLRKNLLANKKTQILYTDSMPASFDAEIILRVYGYNFELKQIEKGASIPTFEGSTIFISNQKKNTAFTLSQSIAKDIDFLISNTENLGSILLVNGENQENYIADIQHVRRRETIAMTPADCLTLLKQITGQVILEKKIVDSNLKKSVEDSIANITGSPSKALLGSSGLSIQYAILMGLVDYAEEHHSGKAIKLVVPTNCYGGTNDQARRVAACLDQVEIVDLAVDGGQDMVQSIELVLAKIAEQDAIPFIIAEIPTNPRVEVPDLLALKATLSTARKTKNGQDAIAPVFILDQTFCPNVHFLGEGKILSNIQAISFSSGSKFPSGGLCTAGYCVGNKKTDAIMKKIDEHLRLCDNEATALQIEILAKQLPSMKQRITDAYKNTREFVNFIQDTLPTAKINFVSEALASEGFTPSVFSLDLPTKGNTAEEKEAYKRALNLKLINLMITEIPTESKFCVSYGQLKGCYWTVPATSTQGTTKEGDKDYIVRASLSPDLDLELHKKVFAEFVERMD